MYIYTNTCICIQVDFNETFPFNDTFPPPPGWAHGISVLPEKLELVAEIGVYGVRMQSNKLNSLTPYM